MTTNNVPAPFEFEGREIRVLTVGGDPWWVAADVCAVLEIANPRDALRKTLDDDEKGVATVYTPGGDQQVSVINEPGLYSLVLRSRKPQARAFKRWITHEVIPQIRRTGRYAVSDSRDQDVPAAMAEVLRLIARAAGEAFASGSRLASAVEDATRAVDGLSGRIADLADRTDAGTPHVPGQARAGRIPPDGPLWHVDVPEEALTFDAVAELLGAELGRPELSRNRLFGTARDAGLLRQLEPPYGGYSITDRRLGSLFRVRRISGAVHGWPCVHHFQPVALPQGVVIMRQLVLQDIGRGVL